MKVRAIALFTTLLLSCNLCVAQGTFEGWYQIEMIVYSRPQHNSVEIWPNDINLNYPLNWQQLHDPNAVSNEPIDRAETQAVEPDLDRTPFYKLPKDARNLNAASDRLNAQAGFNVLFHEAWRQIVVNENNSPSILIFGGQSFGDHNELEGSVTIHVSRYLHINTNLWLSQFQTNAGQSRNQWPALPQQPQKRLEQQTNDYANHSLLGRQSDALSTISAFDFADGSDIDSALTDFLAAPYVPREIITMTQTRKMRSDELHYLDHPRMGILIKILPYTPPKPSSLQVSPTELTIPAMVPGEVNP
ncbi:peptidoglycan binding protein CsiV [Gilvimarinus polysaccharolyticus]|uniref:peptidoglycan binding protein CsiV n=1 Tax=Gilvimarinus polysaccharolyticus TaxID=863921 RepID=UPI0006733C9F|nr:peptidoglycan binding protein CsiV [Gilvimarinus polysaccharolyticus]